MENNEWYKGHEWESMIVDLQSKDVDIIHYRDPHRPHDDSIAVYERKAFTESLKLHYNKSASVYIELPVAYKIYQANKDITDMLIKNAESNRRTI